ncbi:HPr family phosphocarrier protein [Pontibacter sp. JAM-7]|uniref:HPr family phosphocarrier protein n=1 Tax=Pontibacter sp. JAM-7 TaxID=3366581 RepID=UPI003AF6C8B4
MLEKQIEIINKLGLHARAAAKLISVSSRFASTVWLIKDGREVDGKSIISVMMLAAAKGSWLTVRIEGEDEANAMAAIETLINNRFEEDE